MTDPAPDLSATIEDVAKAPRKSTGDNGSLEEHSLADMIAADKYLKKKAVGLGRGFRIGKIVPGGAP